MKKLRLVYLLQAGEESAIFSPHFHTTWGPPLSNFLYFIRELFLSCLRPHSVAWLASSLGYVAWICDLRSLATSQSGVPALGPMLGNDA